MIITRTPVRISFFGGGTDYPAYYRRRGGAVLATTVDKYVYVTVQNRTEFFDHQIQVHYSKVEAVDSLDQIQIPNVREALRLVNIQRGVEIHLVSDLPARTGLGSSSASTVGLLNALHGHQGALRSELELARQAVYVEQEMIRERVGSQDQYVCAYGGFLFLQFTPDDEIRVQRLPLGRERIKELEQQLLMMYTGLQRTAHEVLIEQLEKTEKGDLDDQLAIMKDQVAKGVEILMGPSPLRRFGQQLHEAWELKRSLSSKISNAGIDDIYRRARAAGALGGKLLGAGSGGFLLLFVEPDCQESVCEALPELRQVKFRLEPQGTRIIYYSP